jgi:hypothetical protein
VDATLAAYLGESVTLRYNLRDLAEMRMFHHCRATLRVRAVFDEVEAHRDDLQ